MDKLKTRILLISLILVLLFSFQGVSAVTDDNGNLTSESIDLSICDNEGDVSSDKLSSAYESNNPDDVLSASSELDVLSVDEVPFTTLEDEISSTNENVELLHDYYRYQGSGSTISIYGDNRIIDGRGAVIDMAGSTIRAFNVYGSGITIKNLTIKNANYNGDGGAIRFSSTGTVENCNFTNNSARYGGAIEFDGTGTVTNCNFTNNKATGDCSYGGAIWFTAEGTVGTVENCNFTNNTASEDGGAVYFWSNGEVRNCNFTNNSARYGGAIRFSSTGNVTNCNFTGNTATRKGGAVYFLGNGNVTNCNFTNNKATGDYSYGGAVYFWSNGEVRNCNFTANTATELGGAILMGEGSVENCNFTDNQATVNGGAIDMDSGTVENCNFTANTATNGSAIYFYSISAQKSAVSNSTLLNNRANAKDLQVTKNENNITIIFTGNNNILNAIYSRNDAEVSFSNVTYWGANGIVNTDTFKPPISNNAAGQNITVSIVINDKIDSNEVYVTDEWYICFKQKCWR